jgi:outer membrane protein assembly factor BamA
MNALWDSRDGPISPSRGLYAKATYSAFFEGLLGGDSNWQQLGFDARTYFRLSRDARHKLAFWFSGDFVVAGTAPYLDLPATGMDTYGRSGRGYPQGRFRGQELVYGEAEYRWTATRNGLFGMVAFLNTQTLRSEETGEKLFDSFATGAGVGVRLMLNKRSQTNLCFDIGWGKDGSRAVYFAVQEAF